MKIHCLITTLDVGGAERMLYETVRRVAAAGHDVRVSALFPDGTVGEWLRVAGIPVQAGLMRYGGDPLCVPRLVAALRGWRPDIVHTWLFHANMAGRCAAKLAGVPRVISSIRVYDNRRWHHVLDRLTLGLVDAVTANSTTVTERLAAGGYPRARLHTIVNGVALLPERPAWPADVPRDSARPLLVSVGRQHPQKGFDVLLRALALLPAAQRPRLLVSGRTDAATTALAQLQAELGLQADVTFTGWRADARTLAAHADLFVLPSRWEGMPNALLEAQADGVACVATAVDGSREVIADGETGLLVPPDDPRALAEALARLLGDAALRRRLGDAARVRAEREFSLDAMAEKTLTLYQQVAGSC